MHLLGRCAVRVVVAKNISRIKFPYPEPGANIVSKVSFKPFTSYIMEEKKKREKLETIPQSQQ